MDDVIRRKLLTDAEGTGDDRRLALLAKMIFRWANEDHKSPSSDANLKKIRQTIGQCDSSMQKTQMINKTAVEELQYYGQLSTRIANDINVAHQRIAECRKALQDAKQVRKHRQEYDALASLIKRHRARKDSAKLLNELQRDLSSAGERRDKCLQQLDHRRKQLHVLFVSLRELSELTKAVSE